MTEFECWIPTECERDQATTYEADTADEAAEQCAEAYYYEGDQPQTITVCVLIGETVKTYEVEVSFDPTFNATEKPS